MNFGAVMLMVVEILMLFRVVALVVWFVNGRALITVEVSRPLVHVVVVVVFRLRVVEVVDEVCG